MAIVNLLNGEMRKSIGSFTGQKWKDKKVVHAKIWSKRPPNQKQINSLHQFGCIQRITTGLRKKALDAFDLDTKKMTEQNAICSLLKGAIKKTGWDTTNLESVFTEQLDWQVLDFTLNNVIGQCALITEFGGDWNKYKRLALMKFIVNDNCKVLFCQRQLEPHEETSLLLPLQDTTTLTAFTVAIWHNLKGDQKLGGYSQIKISV